MALRNGMRFMGLWLEKKGNSRWEHSRSEDGDSPSVIVYCVGPRSWQMLVYFERCTVVSNGPTRRATVEKMRRYIRELDEQLVYFSSEK